MQGWGTCPVQLGALNKWDGLHRCGRIAAGPAATRTQRGPGQGESASLLARVAYRFSPEFLHCALLQIIIVK